MREALNRAKDYAAPTTKVLAGLIAALLTFALRKLLGIELGPDESALLEVAAFFGASWLVNEKHFKLVIFEPEDGRA